MIEKDRIIFRQEPGRQPGADARFLRKQVLKAVSREIARRQISGQEVTRDLDILEVQLAWWPHYGKDPIYPRRPSDWGEWSLLVYLQNWKPKKRGSKGNRTPA